MVKVLEADATAAEPPPVPGPGLLVSNPPYGDRLTAGGQKGMKTFYFKLGERLGALEEWRKLILVGNEAFESAFHARPSAARWLWNGPIRCQLLSYPGGR
jgi:putative N6-adenine-specific DNA methylase